MLDLNARKVRVAQRCYRTRFFESERSYRIYANRAQRFVAVAKRVLDPPKLFLARGNSLGMPSITRGFFAICSPDLDEVTLLILRSSWSF